MPLMPYMPLMPFLGPDGCFGRLKVSNPGFGRPMSTVTGTSVSLTARFFERFLRASSPFHSSLDISAANAVA